MSNTRNERGRITTNSKARKRKEAIIKLLYTAHSNTWIQCTNSLKEAACQNSFYSHEKLTCTVGNREVAFYLSRKMLIRKI